MSEEDNILTLLKGIQQEITKLRESTERLETLISDSSDTANTIIANTLYDLYTLLDETRKLFQWYAEKTTGRTYL